MVRRWFGRQREFERRPVVGPKRQRTGRISRTLSRGRLCARDGNLAGFRTVAGCQPAIQPIDNRHYFPWADALIKNVAHPPLLK